jgi:hypothetical protein
VDTTATLRQSGSLTTYPFPDTYPAFVGKIILEERVAVIAGQLHTNRHRACGLSNGRIDRTISEIIHGTQKFLECASVFISRRTQVVLTDCCSDLLAQHGSGILIGAKVYSAIDAGI